MCPSFCAGLYTGMHSATILLCDAKHETSTLACDLPPQPQDISVHVQPQLHTYTAKLFCNPASGRGGLQTLHLSSSSTRQQYVCATVGSAAVVRVVRWVAWSFNGGAHSGMCLEFQSFFWVILLGPFLRSTSCCMRTPRYANASV